LLDQLVRSATHFKFLDLKIRQTLLDPPPLILSLVYGFVASRHSSTPL
jgi:hypothetical protein